MDDRFNTISGWVLFAAIVALGTSIASGLWFHAGSAPELEEGQFGYFVKGEEIDTGGDGGPDLGTLIANADPAAGEKVFAKCTACHTIDQGGPNGIGPNLYATMGKAIAGHAGFTYSSALSGKGGEWTWENMNEWLKSPRGFANGTKMSFAGLSKPEDRANVMAFMATYGGAPAPPAPAAAEEPAEGGADAPGDGPGPVAGAEAGEVESAGGASADQPVPSSNAGGDNGGATKVD